MRVAFLVLMALAGCASTEPYLKQVGPLVRGDVPVIAGTLDGGPWLVEDINGGGVIDNARLEMKFADGRVSGRSGCNNFSGNWQQDGAAIVPGPFAVTRMGCSPALMEMERKFLVAIEAVRTVTFDATGAAYLRAPDGRVVKIRRD